MMVWAIFIIKEYVFTNSVADCQISSILSFGYLQVFWTTLVLKRKKQTIFNSIQLFYLSCEFCVLFFFR